MDTQMDTLFLPIESAALERIALLELIASSHLVAQCGNAIHKDCHVPCETRKDHKTSLKDTPTISPALRFAPRPPLCSESGENGLPDAIRRVLLDARAPALAHDLVASGALRLFVDAGALQRRCELVHRQWRDQDLLRAFVARQASVPMIRAFFRTATRATIAQLRSELGVTAPTKPRALTAAETDALFDDWYRLTTIGDPRERYVALHERSQRRWSLATLFAALGSDSQAGHPSSSPQELHHVRHAT